MSRDDYYFDPEKRVFQGERLVPYEHQTPILCQCGYEGKIGDLGVPDDDSAPLVCPQCLTTAWEFGIGSKEAEDWLAGKQTGGTMELPKRP